MKISLKNHQKKVIFNTKKIKQICEFVIANEWDLYLMKNHHIPHDFTMETNIHFIDEKHMIELNSKFFNKQSPTDVITVGYLDQDALNGFLEEEFVLADIFISIDEAIKVHDRYKNDLDHEILLYLIHGILHSFEYDDTKDSKRIIMKNREKFYMSILTHTTPIIKS